ncbi:MAG: sodium-dependent transporter, partial [Sphingomonadales bacterium]
TAEITIGRMGHMSPIGAARAIIKKQKVSRFWMIVGYLSLAVPFFGFTYYSVVAGWSLNYAVEAGLGSFEGFSSEASGGWFQSFAAQPWHNILLQGLVIILTAYVVGRGIKDGIEKAVKIMMPALFLMLVLMMVYGMFSGGFGQAVEFLFTPDFSEITAKTFMLALGQAFFSVGVGVGFMMAYGAYLPAAADIPKTAVVIASVDTLVALLAGLAIFPIVFASGLSPSQGPGLVFITMPVAFGGMAFGQIIGAIFFLLLFVAAFTSTIAMLEPIIAYMEERFDKARPVLAFSAAGVVWLVGIFPALSNGVLADVRPLSFIAGLEDRDIFGAFDFFVTSILIPVNALMISLFAGWVIHEKAFKQELSQTSDLLFTTWRVLIKFLAPVAVMAITYFGLVG